MDFGGATQTWYPMDHSFLVVFQCVLTFVDVFWCIFICWGSWLTQINRDSHLHQSYLLCEWFELLISIFEDDYVHDMYSNYDYIYVWDCTCHYLRILYIYTDIAGKWYASTHMSPMIYIYIYHYIAVSTGDLQVACISCLLHIYSYYPTKSVCLTIVDIHVAWIKQYIYT
jgi:hypothetical protein